MDTRRPRAKLRRSMAPRPKLASGDTRSHLLGVRLSPEEHRLVHEAAELVAGQPGKTSDVFRPIIVRAARRILAQATRKSR